jgi:AraC-like DNA-binding protein
LIFSTFDILHILTLGVLAPLIGTLVYKGKKSISNQLMALFFFAQALNSLSVLCWTHFAGTLGKFPYFAYSAVPFFAIWGPSMYLYIRSETSRNMRLQTSHLVHFLPFILCGLYFLFAFHLHPLAEKKELLLSGGAFNFNLRKFYSAFIAVQVFAYNVLSITSIQKYGRSHPLQSGAVRHRFHWNRFIIYGYFLACICNNIASWVFPHTNTADFSPYFFISAILFLLYFSVILVGALLGSHFGHPLKQPKSQYFTKELAAVLKARLDAFMAGEKPYLQFNLTLAELASSLGYRERELSEYINTCYRTTFQDFLNQYRIEEAKKLLAPGSDNRKTILEIAYESGFNSKSAFNHAFRKHTQTTPSNFRKEAFAAKAQAG